MGDASEHLRTFFALSTFLSEEGLRSSQAGIHLLNPSADKNLLSSYYVPGGRCAVVTQRVMFLLS